MAHQSCNMGTGHQDHCIYWVFVAGPSGCGALWYALPRVSFSRLSLIP
jgi:hypothetical protein